MPIQAPDINDIVMSGLRQLFRDKMADISRPYQEYVGLNQIIKARKKDAGGGYGLQWDVLVRTNEGTRFVGMFNKDVFEDKDGLIQARADYQAVTNNWIWDISAEVFNSGDFEKIVDFLGVKRTMARNDYDEKIENAIWRKPASSSDTLTLKGLPYSIVPNNNATGGFGASEGFEGGNPAGFPAGAFGISSTDYPAHSNQVKLFTNPVMGELDEALKVVMYRMHFTPPIQPIISDFADGPPDTEIYTTYEGRSNIMKMGLSANENIGKDVAFYKGQAEFGGVQVIAVPALDTAALVWGPAPMYSPYILVNWKYMHPVIQPGWWYREDIAKGADGRHLVNAAFFDSKFTFANHKRREAGGLVYKIAA